MCFFHLKLVIFKNGYFASGFTTESGISHEWKWVIEFSLRRSARQLSQILASHVGILQIAVSVIVWLPLQYIIQNPSQEAFP